MMSSQILWQFKKGDKIAQLFLLSYISINSSNDVWMGRFSSTDQKQSFWTSLVSEFARPTINIKINGKRFSGLLNTGSDTTVISKHLWPKSREGNGTPLQYSCLENPMDGGAWQAAVHGVAKSWTRLSDFTSLHFTSRHETALILCRLATSPF